MFIWLVKEAHQKSIEKQNRIQTNKREKGRKWACIEYLISQSEHLTVLALVSVDQMAKGVFSTVLYSILYFYRSCSLVNSFTHSQIQVAVLT